MSKIFYIVVIIVSVAMAYVFFIEDDNEFQILEKNTQNIFLKETEKQEEIENKKKEISKAEEKKNINKFIIYSIITVLVLLVIVFVIFLLFKYYIKYIKKKKILFTEQLVNDFIKIGYEKLPNYKFRFITCLFKEEMPPLNSLEFDQTNDKIKEFVISKKDSIIKIEKERFILKFCQTNDQLKLFANSSDEDPRDTLLGLFDPGIDKNKMKSFFKEHHHEDLLNLILISRLGFFGKEKNINDLLLNFMDINEESSYNEIRKCFIENFNNSEVKNEIYLLENFEGHVKKKNSILNYRQKNSDLFENLKILIGDRNNDYQFHQEIYDIFCQESPCDRYYMYDNENEEFFPGCITIYFILEAISSIFSFCTFFYEFLTKEEELFLKIMIKRLVLALELFLKFTYNL